MLHFSNPFPVAAQLYDLRTSLQAGLTAWTRFSVCALTLSLRVLRSRLTLGGRTFPRKPQTFDGGVSRSALATHAGILSSMQSTASSDTASARIHCSSTNTLSVFPSFGVMFEPR